MGVKQGSVEHAKEVDIRFNRTRFQIVSFNGNTSNSLVLEDALKVL